VIGIVLAKSQKTANRLAEQVVVHVSNVRKPVIDLKTIVESGDKNRIFQKADKPAKEKKRKLNNCMILIRGRNRRRLTMRT
jgi:hypothetical protein